MAEPMKLTYFPLMAKGLGPALVAECSGLPWVGPKDDATPVFDRWGAMKESGVSPFGQLPLLQDGALNIGQCTAIMNYIGKKAGTEGKDAAEYGVSQMLIAEGEDLYAIMQKHNATKFAALDTKPEADQAKLWGEIIPGEMGKLEKLLGGKATFTSSGKTPGELYVFAVMHQIACVNADICKDTPNLKKFYDGMLADASVKKVLDGESHFGECPPYFIKSE